MDDNYKSLWQSVDGMLSYNQQYISKKSHLTSLDRLARKYLAFSILSFTMIWVWIMIGINGIDDINFHTSTVVALCLYFLTASTMDAWLWWKIKALDPSTMQVDTFNRSLLRYRRIHHIFMAILIPMAMALITLILLEFPHDPYFIAGVVSGQIIGVAIAITQYLRFMHLYRESIK